LDAFVPEELESKDGSGGRRKSVHCRDFLFGHVQLTANDDNTNDDHINNTNIIVIVSASSSAFYYWASFVVSRPADRVQSFRSPPYSFNDSISNPCQPVLAPLKTLSKPAAPLLSLS